MKTPRLLSVRTILSKFTILWLKDINRTALMICAIALTLSGVGAAHVWKQDQAEQKAETATQQLTDQDASIKLKSGTPEAEAETPAGSTQPKPGQSAAGSSKMEISVDIPRTTFRVGEDSGEITVKTSTGAAVHWGFYIEPNQPTSVIVKYIHAPGNSSDAKIMLVNGNTQLAEPGTYTLTIKAYKSGNLNSVLATKSITITLLPVIPFTFDIDDGYIAYDEDAGEVCVPYRITTLPHLNLMNINVTAQIIAGDATGMYISVSPPSTYYAGQKICVGLTEPAAPGARTIRATATAYGYTTTDDLKIEVVEVPE